MVAAVFAGDRRVWRIAALAALPLIALAAYYCLRPRFYDTGTNSVEALTYEAHTLGGTQLCIPGLRLPADSAFVQLSVISPEATRPPLQLVLRQGGRTIRSALPALQVVPNRASNVNFPIPQTPAHPASVPVGVCVSSARSIAWGGTPLSKPPSQPPTLAGKPLAARVAVWYLPRHGSERSFASRAGAIFARAALFRPGLVGPWVYPVLLFVLAPLLALAAVRCLALAVAGRGRRTAAWLFAIAALNACSWALITPAFQGPDEVDHFAYVQSLVERGEGPSHDPGSPLARWSGAENQALERSDFFTDHQVGDTHAPWLAQTQSEYFKEVEQTKPRRDDGGGYTTSATHGPLYYLALSPAYLIASHASIFSQLTLMRFTSALIGALVVLFTFLLARELAPRRPWLAVLAALLVAYEPMYGFISGIVNNDVGVNAAAAALELLLIRMLRRGFTIPWGILTGAVLIALPIVKATGLSLYPVAALVFIATLWRHHSRSDLRAWLALGVGAVVMLEISAHVLSSLQPVSAATGSSAISSNANAVSEALHHLPSYLSYLWRGCSPGCPSWAATSRPCARVSCSSTIPGSWSSWNVAGRRSVRSGTCSSAQNLRRDLPGDARLGSARRMGRAPRVGVGAPPLAAAGGGDHHAGGGDHGLRGRLLHELSARGYSRIRTLRLPGHRPRGCARGGRAACLRQALDAHRRGRAGGRHARPQLRLAAAHADLLLCLRRASRSRCATAERASPACSRRCAPRRSSTSCSCATRARATAR